MYHKFAHVFASVVDLVLIAERAVLLDMDALALIPLCELGLLKPGMTLKLVCGRGN